MYPDHRVVVFARDVVADCPPRLHQQRVAAYAFAQAAVGLPRAEQPACEQVLGAYQHGFASESLVSKSLKIPFRTTTYRTKCRSPLAEQRGGEHVTDRRMMSVEVDQSLRRRIDEAVIGAHNDIRATAVQALEELREGGINTPKLRDDFVRSASVSVAEGIEHRVIGMYISVLAAESAYGGNDCVIHPLNATVGQNLSTAAMACGKGRIREARR